MYNDVSLATWLGNTSGVFDINADTASLKKFEHSFPDLSAKIYRVSLKNPNFTDYAFVTFDIPADADSRVLLYQYKTGELKYLGHSPEQMVVEEIKKLKDAGYNLLAVVSNSKRSTPYTNSRIVPLTIRMQNPKGIEFDFRKSKSIHIYLRNVSVTTSTTPFNQDFTFFGNGSWNGNTFTVNSSENTISATFNPVTRELTFSASSTSDKSSSSCSGKLKKSTQPVIDEVNKYYTFGAQGAKLSEIITSLQWKFGGSEMHTYSFSEASTLLVTFREIEYP